MKEMSMSISMYDFSIPVLTRGLTNLSAILDKAAAHAAAKKFDSAVLAQSRLFPDMHPLVRQVQIACDTAKGAAARLAEVEVPKHEDTEATFADLKARVAKTLDFVKSITAAQVKDSDSRSIEIKFPNGAWKFTGLAYLTDFVLPNFYFHVGIVYALLRKAGVEVGKSDYLGAKDTENCSVLRAHVHRPNANTRREGQEAEGPCCLDGAFSFLSFSAGASRQPVDTGRRHQLHRSAV
jgi:uncharacterized protein